MTRDDLTVPAGAPAPDWTGMVYEECPHCDQPHPAGAMDLHLATIHADLPPCTARLDRYDGYACAFRSGHKSAYDDREYWHASARGPVGRTVWTDSADGAIPHKEQS